MKLGRSVEDAGISLAQRTTRRSLLGRVGRGVVAHLPEVSSAPRAHL